MRRVGKLAEELGGLPVEEYRDLLIGLMRDVDLVEDSRIRDLIAAVLDLSPGDYRLLRATIGDEYERALPLSPKRNKATSEPPADDPSESDSNPGADLSGGCAMADGGGNPVFSEDSSGCGSSNGAVDNR